MVLRKSRMAIEILKPFGPSIVKTKLPENIINEMNIYVDQVINDEKKKEELDYGKKLAGNVKQEIYLETDFMKKIKWAEFLATACAEWLAKDREIKMKGKATNSPIPLASVKYYKFSVLLKAGGCHHLYIFCFGTNLPFEIL